MTSVKFKALAILIKTFLETAAVPKFRHSLLHTNLFRYHVLEDSSMPDPGYLPYYPPSFFNTIKYVHKETPLNILSMSTSQWVRILTEDGLTMEMVGARQQYIPCRAELSSPHTDWSVSWKTCRLTGLASDLVSFNFKLLHGLLITRQRLHHLTPAANATCTHCEEQVEEDLQHALIQCSYNCGTGQNLLSLAQNYIPAMSAPSLLRLELVNLEDETLYSLATLISALLLFIWDERHTRTRITLFDTRATLEARCLLLRKTRFANHAAILTEMINNL